MSWWKCIFGIHYKLDCVYIWGPDPVSEHPQLKEWNLANSKQKIVQKQAERARTGKDKKRQSKTQRWVDKMQRRQKAHSQPARQPEEDRKSILLWRSPLDSPDKKHCPLKSWSKHYEARMMKSQIIWHKWGKLPFNNKKWTEKLSTTSIFTEMSVSLALSKTFAMQWTCLSFSPWCKSRTVQTAMQFRPPDFQLVPKWTYAE